MKLFKPIIYSLFLLALCLTHCAPKIYKEQPGFIPIKDISGSQVEYFPEQSKSLGFKENFSPNWKKPCQII